MWREELLKGIEVDMKINQFLEKIFSTRDIGQTSTSTTQKSTDLNRCSKCNGTGFIITRHENLQDFIRECECKKTENMRDRIKSYGISEAFKNYTFKNFNSISGISKYCKAKAMGYVLNFNTIKDTRHNSIAFLGQVGSGKSHLSMAIANSFLDNEIQVFYMPYREAITELKQNILDEARYLKIIQRYKTAYVLYIDDLFKGKITESDINIMFEIINYRYINNKPIIVSSEYKADRLLDFDEAIGSRIIEMSKDYLISIDGKENNYRLRGIV
jgi:DNA replication protein DnaC